MIAEWGWRGLESGTRQPPELEEAEERAVLAAQESQRSDCESSPGKPVLHFWPPEL